MTALSLPRLMLDRRAILHAIAAGGAWGMVVSAALLGLSFYQCGTICLGQIVETGTLSMLAGIVAIGPLVLFQPKAVVPVT